MSDHVEKVAIIGLAGRFSGARTVDELWQRLRNGEELISAYTDDELRARGVSLAELSHPTYVKAGSILEDVDMFDASFFGISPREAKLTNPQHRLFLESAWEAMESAGYDPGQFDGSVGVFAGASMTSYLHDFPSASGRLDPVEGLQKTIGNNRDYLATAVSYRLDLKGPSYTIQTACSTSLVTVHIACENLLTYQCDMALAGGVSVHLPQGLGYRYQDGMTLSPDGRCRAFDAGGKGTVWGQGLGIVVVKRLSEALRDGDTIHAVIRGSAVNNDGGRRVGYAAPSIDGQADVIAAALELGDVKPQTIQYVEAHGTGTPLGDPIEIAALSKVFRASTQRNNFCAIGSVKTNMGHLDTAAGVAGLIKTVLALKHREIPPSLHFQDPNPNIDFDNSPFFVNDRLRSWPHGDTPRRAGVSSFGIGGTNAHVVLEEAPTVEPEAKATRSHQLLILSAKTRASLDALTANVCAHLKQHRSIDLSNVAYTLQVGRRYFDQRRMLVCRDVDDAILSLEKIDPRRVITAAEELSSRDIVFLFSGQGSQYVNMGLDLYRTEPVFKDTVDCCAGILYDHIGTDLRQVLFPDDIEQSNTEQSLDQTYLTQPALFTIEYALAKLWESWGILPQALVGHSIGEYVAACVAGVFSLEDALSLVAARGHLMQSCPPGLMLAVPLSEEDVRPLLTDQLSLAAVNAPAACVVSGGQNEIAQIQEEIAGNDIETQALRTSHAFHSHMMDSILEPFVESVRQISLKAPTIPFLSNVSGQWITADEATNPHYWAKQLRSTVRFADCIDALAKGSDKVFLEVGPGKSLTTLSRRQAGGGNRHLFLSSLRNPQEQTSDVAFALNTLGRLWLSGVRPDWPAFHQSTSRRRLPLPTYPFQRQRFWTDPPASVPVSTGSQTPLLKLADISDWFYAPAWTRCPWVSGVQDGTNESASGRVWLVFVDGSDFGTRLVERIKSRGYDPWLVNPGEQYQRNGDRGFTIDPRSPQDYSRLMKDLHSNGTVPETVLHFWCHSPSISNAASAETIDIWQFLGFYSLVYLSQALDKEGVTDPLKISVVTGQAQEVVSGDTLIPAKAMVHGPCVVIPQELTNVACQTVDVPATDVDDWGTHELDAFLADIATKSSGDIVAYRGGHRWKRTFSPLPLAPTKEIPPLLRERGTYLITGGLGGVGLLLAGYLARKVQAKLVLTSRSEIPPRSQWGEWLAAGPDHDQKTKDRLKAIASLEEIGAEVFVASADVADPQAMREVIHDAQSRFGNINGFIHAAGIVNGPTDGAILDLDEEYCAQIFGPKVEGLLNLASLVQEMDLDFCFLTSSLSGVLGGLGLCAYAAANVFMDAFAYTQNRSQTIPWLSVNWDAWLIEQGTDTSLRIVGMSTQESLETFDRIISRGQAGQTVVSVGPLQARIAQWVEIDRSRVQPLEQDGKTSARQEQSTTHDTAGTPTERVIAEVWRELLGLDSVGIHDDFFELGGDSLLGMEIIARIKRAGIPLTPKHIIEHPTIAELAALALAPEAEVAEQGEITGPVNITPAMHRFLYERGSPCVHRWNLATLLETKQRIDLRHLELAARHLLNHHDALRLRLSESNGNWQAKNLACGDSSFLSMVNLSDLSEENQITAMEAHSEDVQASFNLTHGPILNLTLFDLGDDQPQKLFFAAHHFILEGLSWTVFWHDLETACQQLNNGQEISFPAKTHSFKDWAEALQEYSQSAELQEELSYWLNLPWSAVRRLPTDLPAARKDNTNASAREVCASFTKEETDYLLFGSKNSDPEVILVTALAQSLAGWTGSEVVLFDQYRHGRDALPTGVDTSHTIGFFISHNPMVIDLSEADTREAGLTAVQKQVRNVPNKGYGYDLIRCLSGDRGISEKLNSLPRSEVLFNYRGRLTDIFTDSALFKLAPELSGSADDPRGISITGTHDPSGIRYYPISISADIISGRLIVKFVYSENLHHRSTISKLRDAFSESLQIFGGSHDEQSARMKRAAAK